jgi:hypothetical protein
MKSSITIMRGAQAGRYPNASTVRSRGDSPLIYPDMPASWLESGCAGSAHVHPVAVLVLFESSGRLMVQLTDGRESGIPNGKWCRL